MMRSMRHAMPEAAARVNRRGNRVKENRAEPCNAWSRRGRKTRRPGTVRLGGNAHRPHQGGQGSLLGRRKLSGGEFSGLLFIRLKAVEQGRLGKGCRSEIGSRLPGWRGYAPAGGRQARPDLTRVKSGKKGLRFRLTPYCCISARKENSRARRVHPIAPRQSAGALFKPGLAC